MWRHRILLVAHYQPRPLPFKFQPVCLSTTLISGRDIEVMSRHLLFSVPSVLMSRPQNDVATSLSLYSFSFCVATSFLGCDHLVVCMMTSCCDLDFLARNCVGGLLVFITFNFMSQPHGDVTTSFCFQFLFFRLRPQYVATDFFLSNYFPDRDIKVMSGDILFFFSALLWVAT